ncbi:MAG: helix-turn-helix domain-containing protein [Bacteroidales bacterium]|nr:helix-turn-helix domain-containing protein [Bacteroidales bacterium]
MAEPRLIGEIIDEILADLRELQQRYEADCVDVILTCKEAASYIGKTPQTISSYIAQGRLHKVSNGVKVGISKIELQKFIKE